MTPGIHPIIVRITLIKNVPPRPCLVKTANGGKSILSIIVINDIVLVLEMLIN